MGLAPCVLACRKDGIGAQPSGAQSGEIGAISFMEEGTGACGVTSLCEKGDWNPAWWSWSLWWSIIQKGTEWSQDW